LFLNVVFTILATIGAVVVLAIFAIGVLYIWLARRIRIRVRQSLNEFESLRRATLDADDVRDLSDTTGASAEIHLVPPMRIHVTRSSQAKWENESQVASASQWIAAQGLDNLGDYCIDELPDCRMRVFISPNNLLVAVIREEDPCEAPYVEFCFDLGAGKRGGVSNPPETTLPLPFDAIGEHFPDSLDDGVDFLPAMLERARKLSVEHTAIPIGRNEIERFFEQAHAIEMDYRIARGGLTEEEIRQALGGSNEYIDPKEVESIQWEWQDAIEEFLLLQSSKAIQSMEDDTVIAVYDGSSRSYLYDRLQDFYVDELDLHHLSEELKTLLERFKPREALARFRPFLPENLRYDLIDQLRKPVEADFYLLPQFE
jgi:hypothetical protein